MHYKNKHNLKNIQCNDVFNKKGINENVSEQL